MSSRLKWNAFKNGSLGYEKYKSVSENKSLAIFKKKIYEKLWELADE